VKHFALQALPARGDVAQLGEHQLCKLGVAGSTPVVSTHLSSIRRSAGLLFSAVLLVGDASSKPEARAKDPTLPASISDDYARVFDVASKRQSLLWGPSLALQALMRMLG
jgi:hypothetical protein